MSQRIIALIDMDCFYVQVEERDDPSIKGKPAAVVQYNAWKGGGIIAVNYEARARGVGRHIRGEEAKSTCPEIILVKVPESRGKADLTKYRTAGEQVIKVLTEWSACVERASIDEAYIDLTEAVESRLNTYDDTLNNINRENLKNNFILGSDSLDDWIDTFKSNEMVQLEDLKLLIGAEIVGGMRKAVFDRTGFRCSAGVAHNKVLAKLACGINKPNKQTVVPDSSVPELFNKTKLKKVRGLGGKLGDELVEKLQCDVMSDLVKFSSTQLSAVVGEKAGAWLYNLARGKDDELVTPRQLPKSIGCNKMFNGPEVLITKDKVKYWIQQLSAEVVERLDKDLVRNNRRAKSITLSVKFESHALLSRACGLTVYNADRMAKDAIAVLEKLYQTHGHQPIHNLGLVASKFEDELDITNCTKISNYFVEKGIPSKEGAETDMETPCSSKSLNLNPGPAKLEETENVTNSKVNSSSSNDGFFNREEVEDCVRVPESVPHVESSLPLSESQSPTKSVMRICDRCKKSILMWDMDTHLDYHVAKDLQRELNGMPALAPATAGTSSLPAKKSPKKLQKLKRKRGGGSEGGGKRRMTGMKTIDTYFTQN